MGVATVCVGLMAGLFFAFSVAVMPGLTQVDDVTFVSTMRSVNRSIQNPLFAVAFMGALVTTAAAVLRQLRRGHGMHRRGPATWTLAACGLYLVALIITMSVNVPLNDSLDALDPRASAPVLAAGRAHFEATWTTTNDLRTLLCTAALGCLHRALTKRCR